MNGGWRNDSFEQLQATGSVGAYVLYFHLTLTYFDCRRIGTAIEVIPNYALAYLGTADPTYTDCRTCLDRGQEDSGKTLYEIE